MLEGTKPQGLIDSDSPYRKNTELFSAIEHMYPGYDARNLPGFLSVSVIDFIIAFETQVDARLRLDKLIKTAGEQGYGIVHRTSLGIIDHLKMYTNLAMCAPLDDQSIDVEAKLVNGKDVSDMLLPGELLGQAVGFYKGIGDPIPKIEKTRIPGFATYWTEYPEYELAYTKIGILGKNQPIGILSFLDGSDIRRINKPNQPNKIVHHKPGWFTKVHTTPS